MKFFNSRLIYKDTLDQSFDAISQPAEEVVEVKEGIISDMANHELDSWIDNYKEADEPALRESFILIKSLGEVITHQELRSKKEDIEKLLKDLQAYLDYLIEQKILNRDYGVTENLILYWQEILDLSDKENVIRLRHPYRLEELLDQRAKGLPLGEAEVVQDTREQLTQIDRQTPSLSSVESSEDPHQLYLGAGPADLVARLYLPANVFEDHSYASRLRTIHYFKKQLDEASSNRFSKAVKELLPQFFSDHDGVPSKELREFFAFAIEAANFFYDLGGMITIADLQDKSDELKRILDGANAYMNGSLRVMGKAIWSIALPLWQQLQAYESNGRHIEYPLANQSIENFSDQDLQEAIEYAKRQKEAFLKKENRQFYDMMADNLALIQQLGQEVRLADTDPSLKKRIKKTLKWFNAFRKQANSKLIWREDLSLMYEVLDYLRKINEGLKDRKKRKSEVVYRQPNGREKFKRTQLLLLAEDQKQQHFAERMQHRLMLDARKEMTAFAIPLVRSAENQEALSRAFVDINILLDEWVTPPPKNELSDLYQRLVESYKEYSGENPGRGLKKELKEAFDAIVYQWLTQQWKNADLTDADLRHLRESYCQIHEKYKEIHRQRSLIGRAVGARKLGHLQKNYSIIIEVIETIEGLKSPIYLKDMAVKLKELKTLKQKLKKAVETEMLVNEEEATQFNADALFLEHYISREARRMELCLALTSKERQDQPVILRREAEELGLKSDPEILFNYHSAPSVTLNEIKAEAYRLSEKESEQKLVKLLEKMIDLSLPEIFYDMRSQSQREADLKEVALWLEELRQMKENSFALGSVQYLENWLKEVADITIRKQQEQQERQKQMEEAYFGANGIFNKQ